MQAIDPDASANLTYSIVIDDDAVIESMFLIEAHSGILTTKLSVELDRETREWYNFTVMVSDSGHPALNATASMSIRILDTNDNIPVSTDPAQPALLDPPISEMPHGLNPPLLLYRFRASDPDLCAAGLV